MTRRASLAACVVVAFGLLSATALAGATFHVKPSVTPQSAAKDLQRTLRATGHSPRPARLWVYLAPRRCAKLRSVEAARPKTVLEIGTKVFRGFDKTKTFVPETIGSGFACAYLTRLPPYQGTQLAAGISTYQVTAP